MKEPKFAGATVQTGDGVLFVRVNNGTTINPWIQFPLDNSHFELYSWSQLKTFGIS